MLQLVSYIDAQWLGSCFMPLLEEQVIALVGDLVRNLVQQHCFKAGMGKGGDEHPKR